MQTMYDPVDSLIGANRPRPIDRWILDLMPEHLTTGERIQILTILATASRTSPAITIQPAFTGQAIAAVLDDLVRLGHSPPMIALDQALPLHSPALVAWADQQPIPVVLTRPGSPPGQSALAIMQRRLRTECLNRHACASITDLQAAVDAWRVRFNRQGRP
jgi:transposase InsO family protein